MFIWFWFSLLFVGLGMIMLGEILPSLVVVTKVGYALVSLWGLLLGLMVWGGRSNKEEER